MKVLLDENLPKRLKLELGKFEVATVVDRGWQGLKNGDLIRCMLADGFSAMLTFDKNLQFQQNFARYPVVVVLLNARDNQFVTLRPLMPQVIALLESMPGPGVFEIRPA